jgi:hypothetical protein
MFYKFGSSIYMIGNRNSGSNEQRMMQVVHCVPVDGVFTLMVRCPQDSDIKGEQGLWSWPNDQTKKLGWIRKRPETVADTAKRALMDATGYEATTTLTEPLKIRAYTVEAGQHIGKLANVFATVSLDIVETGTHPDDEANEIGWFPLETVSTMSNVTPITHDIATRLPELIPRQALRATGIPLLQ